MGVYIRTIKPTKFLLSFEDEKKCIENNDYSIIDSDNSYPLYCLEGFEPTQHLTQFDWGYWECEQPTDNEISVPYSTWGQFRLCLAKLVDNKLSSTDYWYNKTLVDKPFFEIINFADNEGAFDYLICEELVKDFEEYYDKAKELYDNEENQHWWYMYQNILNIIKDCIECKGVVYYS